MRCGSSFMRSPTTSAISCARWRRWSRSRRIADHLIKIGAKVVSDGRYVIFQTEVAIPRQMFQEILRLIRNCGRSHHQPLRETFDVMHSSNRKKECVQVPAKWPDQTLAKRSGYPRCWLAVSTSRLSCKTAGKTRKLMPVWDSSGESRFYTN